MSDKTVKVILVVIWLIHTKDNPEMTVDKAISWIEYIWSRVK